MSFGSEYRIPVQVTDISTASKSNHKIRWKVKQSHYRPEVPRGFQEVKIPGLRDNGPGCWQGCQLYVPAAKVKQSPLQSWSGPEGSRKLRFPDYATMAQNGGKVVSLTHRPPLPPGNTPGTHFC